MGQQNVHRITIGKARTSEQKLFVNLCKGNKLVEEKLTQLSGVRQKGDHK